MRIPFVPGPSDVLHAMGDVRDGLADALALVPRIGAAVGQLEELLGRAGSLMTRAEALLDRADHAIAGVAETRSKADEAIEAVGLTRGKADEAIAGVAATRAAADAAIAAVGHTTSSADALLGRGDVLLARMEPLLGEYAPALTSLAPSVRRLADTLDPSEVDALITLIDRLPRLVTHLDEDILPVLESLGTVGTDVHAIVDTVQDLRQIVKGLPGSRLFRRRGAEEIAEERAAQDGAGAGS